MKSEIVLIWLEPFECTDSDKRSTRNGGGDSKTTGSSTRVEVQRAEPGVMEYEVTEQWIIGTLAIGDWRLAIFCRLFCLDRY
jgi:hypothetical protein